jgi:hypothetical protein
MKVLLSNFAVIAKDGKYAPTIIPKRIATSTWKVRFEKTFFIIQLC